MEKNFFTLILVVAVGILLGVGIVSKQAREPLLRQIAQQQVNIVKAQDKIQEKLGGSAQGNAAPDSDRVKALEQRVTTLESQIKFLVGLLQGGAPGGAGGRPAGPPPEDLTKVYTIDPGTSPVRGKANAPITIVEFVDFQCPFCSRFYGPALEVLSKYPDQVKFFIKNFPLSFHPQAAPAAKAALAANEQGKYWEMVDDLLGDNKDLSAGRIEATAKKIGLDIDKFKKDLADNDAKYQKILDDDEALGGSVDVQGTPTFFLNGHKTNARDFNGFKKEIDAVLGGAK